MHNSDKPATIINVEYANGKYAVNSFEDGEFGTWQNNIDDEFELMLCLEWVVSDLDMDYRAVTVPLRVIERLPQPREGQAKEYHDFLRGVTIAELGMPILEAIQQMAKSEGSDPTVSKGGIHNSRVEWDELI